MDYHSVINLLQPDSFSYTGNPNRLPNLSLHREPFGQYPGIPGGAVVDVNTIPVALIDRVEIISGGTAATYGADAIFGVVNFILKDDFEGLNVGYQYRLTGESDGE